MTGYLIFVSGFLALAIYCLVRGIMARRKAVPGNGDYEEEKRLAKAYLQRAAFNAFIGSSRNGGAYVKLSRRDC